MRYANRLLLLILLLLLLPIHYATWVGQQTKLDNSDVNHTIAGVLLSRLAVLYIGTVQGTVW